MGERRGGEFVAASESTDQCDTRSASTPHRKRRAPAPTALPRRSVVQQFVPFGSPPSTMSVPRLRRRHPREIVVLQAFGERIRAGFVAGTRASLLILCALVASVFSPSPTWAQALDRALSVLAFDVAETLLDLQALRPLFQRILDARRAGNYLICFKRGLVPTNGLGGELLLKKISQTRCLQRPSSGDHWRVGQSDQPITRSLELAKAVGHIGMGWK
jgi:hypothetical protein